MEETLDRTEKRARRMDDGRVLDPWERYRALSDTYDSQFEITEFADRKTRFALVMLGALNALNLLVSVRANSVVQSIEGSLPWLSGYFVMYAVLSVFFFFQAIQALRPRMAMFAGGAGSATPRLGIRIVPDIVAATLDQYYERWTGAEIGQVNREIAHQTYIQARVNELKFHAIDRLYKGLLALAALTAILVSVVAYAGLRP
jgi:hypothetical protein